MLIRHVYSYKRVDGEEVEDARFSDREFYCLYYIYFHYVRYYILKTFVTSKYV